MFPMTMLKVTGDEKKMQSQQHQLLQQLLQSLLQQLMYVPVGDNIDDEQRHKDAVADHSVDAAVGDG